jgi:hypothetical protein
MGRDFFIGQPGAICLDEGERIAVGTLPDAGKRILNGSQIEDGKTPLFFHLPFSIRH